MSVNFKTTSLLILITITLFSCKKDDAANNNSNGTTTGSTNIPVTVSTIAGKMHDHGNAEDGNGADARFWNPGKMIYDGRNNTLYVADGTTIRSIDAANNVHTYMPLGVIGNFNDILDIDLAPGNAGTLYITTKEHDLLKIEPNGNTVIKTVLIDRIQGGNETGSLNTGDQLDDATGVAAGANGELYFFNSAWNSLHRVTLTGSTTGNVNLFAGKATATRGGNAWPFSDGQGEAASFNGSVPDIATDGNGNIYIADFNNDLVRQVQPDGNVRSLFKYMNGFGIDADGPVSTAQANRVTQVTANHSGNCIFFTTYGHLGGNQPSLRMVKTGNEVITLVGKSSAYGDGTGDIAGFSTIGGVAATPDGKTIYVSEPGNKLIRKVVLN